MKVDPTYIEKIARDRATDDMTCLVSITRKTPPEFDPVTGMTTGGAPITVYEGAARIANTSGPVTYTFADEPQAWQSVLVYIPWRVDPVPMRDDVLTVLGARDPVLVDRMYSVEDVDRGGQWRAATTLQCTGTQLEPGTVV